MDFDWRYFSRRHSLDDFPIEALVSRSSKCLNVCNDIQVGWSGQVKVLFLCPGSWQSVARDGQFALALSASIGTMSNAFDPSH